MFQKKSNPDKSHFALKGQNRRGVNLRVSLMALFFCLFSTFAFAYTPTVGTISPSTGSTAPDIAKAFTCTYTDLDGWSNLKEAYLLISATYTALSNSVYLYYDQNTNLLYLRDDANASWLGGFAPGSANTIENSQVKLNCAQTATSNSTNTLTINWNITFKPAYSGRIYNSYLRVVDDTSGSAGWTRRGGYTVNYSPQAGTITPSSGTGQIGVLQNFTATYSDLDGWQNLKYLYLLINNTTSTLNSFDGYYDQNTNRLYLRNDANTTWLGGYAPGSANIIENSFAKLDCSQTTISGSGATLTVNWAITFKAPFTGLKNTYLYVRDDANAYQNWVKKGTWTLPNQVPSLGTITPASGTSLPDQPVSFSATYSDPDTWQNIQSLNLLINTSTSGLNSLYGYYNRDMNKLYLRNDANTIWQGGFAPGSAKTIENSYAKLDCSQTTVSGSGNTLTINWAVTFKPSFTGAKNTYLSVRDYAGGFIGLTKKGAWNILADTTPPTGTIAINNSNPYTNSTAVTLALSAEDEPGGSGLSQMQFSDDNLTWSTPEAYATIKSWTLPQGEGTKTVYVKFKDAAGNWSQAFSDNIILISDTTAPVTTDSGIDGLWHNSPVTVTLNLSDLALPSEPDAYTKLLLRADDVDGSTAFSDAVQNHTVANSDNHDNYTKLMLNFDDSDGSAIFTDKIGKSVTANGNTQIDTAQSKFGGASALFDGNGDYLALADSEDWNFDSGDFTIETWAKLTTTGTYQVICSQRDDANTDWYLRVNIDDSITFYGISGGIVVADFLTPALTWGSSWHHIAVVRSGNMAYIFFDGISQPLAVFTPFSANALPNSTSALWISAQNRVNYEYYFSGWLDELRISKGIARWTSNFTPPQGKYGGVSVDTAQSKFGGSSAFFDGNGNYLSLVDSEDWNFGSGDFTIDFWVRFNSVTGGHQSIYHQYQDQDNYVRVYKYSTGGFGFDAFSGGVAVAEYSYGIGIQPNIDTWYHIAVVRQGANIYIFQDGVSQALTATTPIDESTSFPDLAVGPNIGGISGYYYFNGWLDEFRISKGIARWSSNFTPPSDFGSGVSRAYYSTDGANPNILYANPFSLAEEGIYTIKYYAIDNAGNIEAVKTASNQVKIDTTPPIGSVAINNGDTTTETSDVTLNLTASDSASGMGQGAQAQFSNDNTNWANPQDYAASMSWTLASGFGIKTAYARFKDNAGNWSESVSDTIEVLNVPKERIFIYLNGQRVAMEENNKKFFFHNDHLGGTNVVTDESGAQVEYVEYEPFGSVKQDEGRKNIAKKFTGKELNSSTGLYDYDARQYDARIGRFISPDPLDILLTQKASISKDALGFRFRNTTEQNLFIALLYNPQNLNKYSYCLNNPINYTDPLGLWVAIGERPVRRIGSHTVIILHPDNPNDFKNDTSTKWYKTKTGDLEATLSANPDKKRNLGSPLFGKLKAYPSDPNDRPPRLKNIQRIQDPEKRSDTQLIKDIITPANKYKDNLSYDPTPWLFDRFYNSNSYTYGILKDAKISTIPNLPRWQPGADKPIPLERKE